MASLYDVKSGLEDQGFTVLVSGDSYPSREDEKQPFLRLLDGRVETDGTYSGTLLIFSFNKTTGIDLTEFTKKAQDALRRTGLTHSIQPSTPPIALPRNLSDARVEGARRQRPKLEVIATLIRFRVV